MPQTCLKPALSSGRDPLHRLDHLQGIPQPLRKDRALLRRFQKIDVNEPTLSRIRSRSSKGLRSAFEEHHNVKYTPDALKTAVELSARYINDRKLPDKAIDVIDEVGRDADAGGPPAAARRRSPPRRSKQVIATMARIPAEIGVARMTRRRSRILDTRSQARRVRSGRGDRRGFRRAIKLPRRACAKPTSRSARSCSAGPTGVGKTEVARQLASHHGHRVLEAFRHVRIYGTPQRIAPDRRASGLCRI